MAERIPQSVTKRVSFEAYLASDHVTPATGKTIVITISKNGAAFGNPSGGATNAVEIASGSYYVDLSTTDTGSTGPLIVFGSVALIDPMKAHFSVESAHNGGFDGVPNVIAGAVNGLPLSVDSSGRIDLLKINGTTQTARDVGLNVDATVSSRSTYAGGAVASVTGNVGGSVASVTAPVSIATGQLFVKKNAQLTITFPMTDSTTHLPKTGLAVTATRTIDGAALGACANAPTELSAGVYSLVLAAADLNGSMITVVLSAAASDTRFIGLVTQS